MSEEKKWQFELEEYIRQGEPAQAQKSVAWQTAIGLQEVDGLQTSDYLLDTAKNHIEGKISIGEVQKRIHSYYEQRNQRIQIEDDTKEADIVSARIAELLGEKTFQFSPAEWMTIHRRLFEGVFDFAGKIRDYNITKKEWILNGDTVIYASCNSIKDTLNYDFQEEKKFSYKGLSLNEAVKHLAKFASDIWQIHPFCEGNTRATAVFMIKYLKTLGFEVSNDVFAEHSWYFRNALVRANYNDLKNDIHSTTKYLELFFSNLLMGTNFELKNRFMHVNYVDEMNNENTNYGGGDVLNTENETINDRNEIKKGKNGTINVENKTINKIIEQLSVKFSTTKIKNVEKILIALNKNSYITYEELLVEVGIGRSTVSRYLKELKDLDVVKRVGSNKNGSWIVNNDFNL